MTAPRTQIVLKSSPTGQVWVGDEWVLEAKVSNGGTPAKPGEVLATVYPPGSRKVNPTREPLAPAKMTEAAEGVYELGGIELNEAGQWLVVVLSTTPYKGVQREVISVAAPTG